MPLQETFAEINLNALSENLRVVQEKTGRKEILAVVKADAYGHGAAAISAHLLKNGISQFGVAFTKEALDLRQSGIQSPILIFFDRDNIEECFKYNLTPVVFDFRTAKRISSTARKKNCEMAIHVKVDTGMGRVGFSIQEARKYIPEIAGLKNIKFEGLMSHFSEADLQDKDFAVLQLQNFKALAQELRKKNIRFTCMHIANSAAVLTVPEAHLDMVRPGLMLYGYGCCESEKLRPVLTLKSRIVLLKKVPPGTSISYSRTFITKRRSTIATIPAGYADGYNRRLSNLGEVLINGLRAPVVGRVCMDTIMVDVTGIRDVTYESEVVLLGRQGINQITAGEIAGRTGTIPYEVLTSIGKRVKRIYR